MFTFNLGAVKSRVDIISGQPVYQYLLSVGAINVQGIPITNYQSTYAAAAANGFTERTVYYGLNWGTAEARALFEAAGLQMPNAPATDYFAPTESGVQNPNSGYEMLRRGDPWLNKIASVISEWIRANYIDSNLAPKRRGLAYVDVYMRALNEGMYGSYSFAAELMRVWKMLGTYSPEQFAIDTGGSVVDTGTGTAPILNPTAPVPLPGAPVPTVALQPAQTVQTSQSVATGSVNTPSGSGNVNYSVPISVSQNPDGSLSYTVVSANGPTVNNPAPLPAAREVKNTGLALALLLAAVSMLS